MRTEQEQTNKNRIDSMAPKDDRQSLPAVIISHEIITAFRTRSHRQF